MFEMKNLEEERLFWEQLLSLKKVGIFERN